MTAEPSFDHHHTRHDGLNWHWVEMGDGPAVVLLHGIPESWHCWHHQIPVLARQFRVIALDMKGYGQSDKAEGDFSGSTNTVVGGSLACDEAGEATNDLDCDDGNAAAYPGADEVVGDGIDQDCDTRDLCYEDLDEDLYGSTDTVVGVSLACDQPGEATNDTDCDDNNPDRFPGNPEVVGDGIDQDCDGLESCYVDSDLDGARTEQTSPSVDPDCDDPGEALAGADIDCNDGDASVYPCLLYTSDAADE